MLKLILITFWFALHPVHVSMMSLEYSAEDKGFNVFLKVYYDDFLTDYGTLEGNPELPDLLKPESSPGSKIGKYLGQRVQLFAGGTELSLQLLDYDLADNELKIRLFCSMKKNPGIIKVKNSILTDIYRDQANLVILNYGSFEEGVKLSPEKREHSFIVKK